MIKRITYKIGHCFSPRLKLIIAVGVARDIFFVNAERTHGAPLVVVIRKPQLSYIVGILLSYISFGDRWQCQSNTGISFAALKSSFAVSVDSKKSSSINFSF